MFHVKRTHAPRPELRILGIQLRIGVALKGPVLVEIGPDTSQHDKLSERNGGRLRDLGSLGSHPTLV